MAFVRGGARGASLLAGIISASLLQVNLQVRGLKTGGLKTAMTQRLKLYVQSQRESALAYMASDDAMRRQDINLEESGR